MLKVIIGLVLSLMVFSGCLPEKSETPPCPALPPSLMISPIEVFPYFPFDKLSKKDTAYFESEDRKHRDTLVYKCVALCNPVFVTSGGREYVYRRCVGNLTKSSVYASSKHFFEIYAGTTIPLGQTPVNNKYYAYLEVRFRISDEILRTTSYEDPYKSKFYINYDHKIRSLSNRTFMTDSIYLKNGFLLRKVVRIEADSTGNYIYLEKDKGIMAFTYKGINYYRTK